MVQLMKDYIDIRGRWCDANLLTATAIPPAPTVTADGPLKFTSPALKFHATPPRESPSHATMQWRLAEVTVGRVTNPLLPLHYEIQALWEENGQSTTTIPTKQLELGHAYRVRARACDPSGLCSPWSEPVQFSVSK